MTPRSSHTVIIGGGFSGTLQAINLLRAGGGRVTLIERRARHGEGLAYGEAAPGHLLNVRAKGMHAFPDDPDSFIRWLAANSMGFTAESFVPRQTYGVYLRDLLADAVAHNPDRIALVQGEAVAIERAPGAMRIALADGRAIGGDVVILALGNMAPQHPRGFGADLPRDLYAADPWTRDATSGLRDQDTVLMLGSGLTTVDLVLRLVDEGFGGNIVALSRRGLLPHSHGPQQPFAPLARPPTPHATQLVRSVRARARAIGWRNAIDELRPFTQGLWRSADVPARRRFLRHLRPWWDIHRHRIAPEITARIEALVASGRLRVIAAATCHAEPAGTALSVTITPRGTRDLATLSVHRAINCTGPQSDITTARDPLLQQLTATGMIRSDPLRLGIDVDAACRTIAADGVANRALYAIGPITRGAFWEVIAVPNIRQQVWALARDVSDQAVRSDAPRALSEAMRAP